MGKLYVLSQSAFEYVLEPRSNYTAYVQDARKKIRFPKNEFGTREEVVEYADKYLRIPAENIIPPPY